MEKLANIESYLYRYLNVSRVKDYCPNGLQVEGRQDIKSIVTGVTASQQLIDRAIELNADALLVHHGYFWRGEASNIVGMKKRRLKSLLSHDISLLAYHLPLDMHAEVGNNVQLAKMLGWTLTEESLVNGLPPIVRQLRLDSPLSGGDIFKHLSRQLGRDPLHIDAAKHIERVALCTGAAQSYIHDAIALGVDAFVTGEVSEQTVHEARENNIHFFAAGHNATERFGVKALGEHLSQKFDIDSQFVDIDNPV